MSKTLILENINKNFGSLVAVKDVNLTIEPGEFVCLLGPSGCGKTTLLRIITGFEQPTSGTLRYDGKVINDLVPQKREFGIVFQSYALFPNMTVHQNVAFGLKMRKVPNNIVNERVSEILTLVGLDRWAHHYPAQLSGGQQQRVALGRAIAIKPNVLLLDEPLSALDAKIRIRLRTVIKRLQQDLGITMVYVTHDQEEALSMADRVAVMRDGEIRQIGPPIEIYKTPKTSFIAEFVGTSNFFSGTKQDNWFQTENRRFAVEGLDMASGDEAHVAIRPEAIEWAKSGKEVDAPDNVVEVMVEVVTFLGAVVRVTFTLDGEEMLVDLPEKEFNGSPVKRGDKIRLYFPPDAFHIYSEMFRKLI